MADHRHGPSAVDIAGDEVAVDQVLHSLPDFGDGERIQLALARGGGVEDQGKGRRRRLDDAHTFGAREILRPGGLETVEVEVHLVLGDLDRGLIDVECGENQSIGGRSRAAGLLGRGSGNSGAAADTWDGGRQSQTGGALHEATARDSARRDIVIRGMFLRHDRTSGGAAAAPRVHLTELRSFPRQGLPPPRGLPRRRLSRHGCPRVPARSNRTRTR